MDVDGEKLRRLRLSRVLTLRDLHELSGVAYDTIHRLETGKQQARQITIRKLAKALGVEPQELVKDGRDD